MILNPYIFNAAFFGGLSWFYSATSDYIAIPNNSSLTFGNGTTDNAFSVSLWMNPAAISSGAIFYKTNEYFLQFISSNLYFRTYDISGKSMGFYKSGISSFIIPGSWNHILINYDGSSTVGGYSLYVNGSLVSPTGTINTGYTAMQNTSSSLLITRGSTTNTYIADVYIFNIDMSSNASTIYNSGIPRNETLHFGANIVSFWNATDTSNGASGVLDVGGNNSNNGTLTNMNVATNVVADYPS